MTKEAQVTAMYISAGFRITAKLSWHLTPADRRSHPCVYRSHMTLEVHSSTDWLGTKAMTARTAEARTAEARTAEARTAEARTAEMAYC